MDPKTYGNPPVNRPEINRTEEQHGRGSDARAKAQDAAHNVKDKANELGTQAREKANQASEKVDDAMSNAGQQMSNLAQTVRERAPQQGRMGEIAENTATALERSGRYLQQSNPDTIRSDLESVIRQHPVESLLVGLGLGFVIARSMRR